MNTIIHNVQSQLQRVGVLLTRRNGVATTTRRSQRTGEKSRRAEDTRGRDGVKTGSALLNIFSSQLLPFFVAFVALWCVSLCPLLTAMAQDSVCAEVKIEIKQELTLERQAFEAHMRINNGLSNITLDDVSVTVNFLDEEGNPVQTTSDPATDLETTQIPFFIRLDSTNNLSDLQVDANNLDFTGTVTPSTSTDIYWLIIPTLAAAAEDPEGTVYYVGATLTYTIGGEAYSTEVTPDYIFVKPLPELALDYFLPADVYGDDAWTPETEPPVPFSLGVRVSNRGYGTAWNLTINSAQPDIVDNSQGLLIDFLITGSEVNGQSATESLLVDFGDLGPETVGVARWNMICSLSGVFEEFTATLSHADELGGELTSLIRELKTYTLVRDVLVDLPGRDDVRDFLATDRENPGTWYGLFESENTDAQVMDLSASAAFVLLDETTGTYGLIPSTPLSFPEGFLYARKEIPAARGENGTVSAVRADGKVIAPENVWISKTRKDNPQEGWDYFVHLFDGNATDPASGLPFAYTLVLGEAQVEPQPPVLQPIQDQTVAEEQELMFTVEASDPDGTIPALSAAPLPSGATFTDHGDGTGTFVWTPVVGQAGTYYVTFEASDGELTDSLPVTITVTPDSGYMITASAGTGGTISPSGVRLVNAGADQSFTITADTGYHIDDVLVDGSSVGVVSAYLFTDVSTNHTITALFALDTFTITTTAGAHGSIIPSGAVTVTYGTDQQFTITPDTGYHIIAVRVDGASVDFDGFSDEHNFVIGGTVTLTNIDADHTLEADFAIKTYSILATAGEGGSISPSGELTVDHDADQSFTITPDTGYHIADVLVDGISVGAVNAYTLSHVTAPHSIQAVFASGTDTHTITATAGANGSILPTGTVTVEDGMNQSFTLTAESGYHIADVLVDGMSVGAVSTYTFTNVTDDHTIETTCAADITTYTITATAGANGSITPSGDVAVEDGTDQSFTIMPDPGYHIVDVLVDGTSVGAISAYMFTDVTSDHTIAVTFVINTYTITATAGANGTITPSGDVTVEHGADQGFTITPDTGYYIDNVLVDGSSVGAVDGYILTDVTGNHTIAAVFSTIPPTPTPQPLTISGHVLRSDGLTGLPEVALNGLPGSPTTDELGYYQADVALGWSGTVTPQKLDYSFTPVFRSYSSLMVDQEQQDYTGTAPSQTLTVVLAGDGSGVVTGDGGINCGTVCSIPVEKYTQVYLSAIPDSGSLFAGAEGAECTQEGTCVLTMTEDTTVIVTFGLEPEPSPTPTVGPEPTPTPTTPVIPEPATGFLVILGLLALLGLGLGGLRKKE